MHLPVAQQVAGLLEGPPALWALVGMLLQGGPLRIPWPDGLCAGKSRCSLGGMAGVAISRCLPRVAAQGHCGVLCATGPGGPAIHLVLAQGFPAAGLTTHLTTPLVLMRVNILWKTSPSWHSRSPGASSFGPLPGLLWLLSLVSPSSALPSPSSPGSAHCTPFLSSMLPEGYSWSRNLVWTLLRLLHPQGHCCRALGFWRRRG